MGDNCVLRCISWFCAFTKCSASSLHSVQVGPTGCVVGIDHMKELVDMSRKNIEKDAPNLLKKEVIKLIGELLYPKRILLPW